MKKLHKWETSGARVLILCISGVFALLFITEISNLISIAMSNPTLGIILALICGAVNSIAAIALFVLWMAVSEWDVPKDIPNTPSN